MSTKMEMNEDCNANSDFPMTYYNDIDEASCLTPSSTDKETLFHEGGNEKGMNPRSDHAILKFKVGQRF